MLFEFKIKIFEFIFEISLINSETGNIKVHSILNTLIIYFNEDRIF